MDLIIKYRPSRLEEVIGHDLVVQSLAKTLKRGDAHSFLFSGPSGVGKTTLARIVARMVDCNAYNIIEIDAATHSSVDAMRQLTEMLQYAAMGTTPTRVIIVDEAHALSRQAWQSLLKSVEEPGPNVYWAFCSTEPKKVPVTIRNRCVVYALKPLRLDDLIELGDKVCRAEQLDMNDPILRLMAKQAEGSPRQLLTFIAGCRGIDDPARVLEMITGITEAGGSLAIDLARALVKGESWAALVKIVQSIEESEESTRRVLLAYLTKVVLGAKSDARAGKALEMLDAFADPYDSSSEKAQLLLSLGRCALR